MLMTLEATKQVDAPTSCFWPGGQPEPDPESAPTDGAMRALPAHCSTEDLVALEKEVHLFSGQATPLVSLENLIDSPPSPLQGQQALLVERQVLHLVVNAPTPSPETREPASEDLTQQAAAATHEQQAAVAMEALAVLRRQLQASESPMARALGEVIWHGMRFQNAQPEVRHPQQAGMGSRPETASSPPLDTSPAQPAEAFPIETARDASDLCSHNGPLACQLPPCTELSQARLLLTGTVRHSEDTAQVPFFEGDTTGASGSERKGSLPAVAQPGQQPSFFPCLR